MKVDFTAAYRSIARQVAAAPSTAKALASTDRFALLLQDISPQNRQPAEITDKKLTLPAPSAVPIEDETGPMASYKFAPAELKTPAIELFRAESAAGAPVNIPPEGVKTPTVLEVRRVSAAREFPELRKAERVEAVRELISKSAPARGVDPALGMAVVSAESSFNSNAVSRDGHASKGLFQLLDSTGKQYHQQLGFESSYDPFDPEQSVEIGVGYLRHLHDLFSQPTKLSNGLSTMAAANSATLEKLALAAFNAGEGRVASAQERTKAAGGDPSSYSEVQPYLPNTTQEYVARVLNLKSEFDALFME